MRPIQTLDEAHKYLLYVADALANVSSGYSIERQDRTTLEKCADDLVAYTKEIERVKNNILMKKTQKEYTEILSSLEEKYSFCKRATQKSSLSVTIAKNNLKQIKKSSSDKEVLDQEEYIKKLETLYFAAKQKEETAKKEFEQGVNNG